MNKINLTQIRDTILRIEKKYNLLEYAIHNVKFWQALRVPIYYRIANLTGVMGEAPPLKKYSKFSRLKNIFSFFNSSLFKNPLYTKSARDIIIFDHSRKVLVDNEYIDIYTKYFIDSLLKNKLSFEVYEEPHQNKHYTHNEPFRYHLDFILIYSNICAKYTKLRLNNNEKLFLHSLNLEINKIFQINFNFYKYFCYEIKKFKALYSYFYRLLQKKQAKKIYILVGYGHPAIIFAAKTLGITTIEIQHGTISDYHLGYHYPDTPKDSLDYFPSNIQLWDTFWKNMCTFPVSSNNLIIKNFEYLVRKQQELKNISTIKKQITIISQGPIEPALAHIILTNLQDLKDYTIYYKLHPATFSTWQNDKTFQQLNEYDNFTIIEDSIPLYTLLAQSQFVIGVYSTSLFEAQYFNCNIILVDLPGIEWMQRYIQQKKIKLLKKEDKLITLLSK